MKFSILIPAYNVENYIDTCFENILKQTYQNFEIIIIDDASLDNTSKVIKKLVKKYEDKILFFQHKKNRQVSITRNELIEKATGDYFIFVDSDDKIDCDLLYNINEVIVKDKMPDLVHYGIQHINEEGNKINDSVNLVEFHNEYGTEAFSILYRNYNVLESPCIYAFRTSYIKEKKFKFAEYRNHEDFGLIPLIILKAESVSSIAKIGYYYLQKIDSIMRYEDLDRDKKNADDLLYHFDYLIKNTKVFFKDKSLRHDISFYLINALFYRARILPIELKNWFISEIIKRKVSRIYFPLTFKEMVRHIIMMISCRLYLYIFYYDKGIKRLCKGDSCM